MRLICSLINASLNHSLIMNASSNKRIAEEQTMNQSGKGQLCASKTLPLVSLLTLGNLLSQLARHQYAQLNERP